jgi:hypothetical protein
VVLKRNDQLRGAIDRLNGKTLSGRAVNVEEAKSPVSNEGPIRRNVDDGRAL